MTIVYLIPIILSIAWCIKYDRQEEFDIRKSHRFWFLYVILSLITGLSYALGGDKQQYLTQFEELSGDITNFAAEIEQGIVKRGQMPLWVSLNFFSKMFFDSFYFVQLVESFFVNFAIFYTFKRYTQHVFFAILFFCLSFNYFNFNTEIMREGFAVGLFLLATEAYFRRKYLIFALLFAIAMLCHVSAIVMLLFPFMTFRITPKRFPLLLLAALLFWFISNFLFSKIVSVLLGQQGALISKILHFGSFSSGGIGAFIFYSFIYLASPFLLMHYGIQRGIQDADLIKRKEKFMTMYLCISIVVVSFLPLARFHNYLTPVFICLTTDTIFTIFSEKKHFISKTISFLLVWVYSTFQYFAISPKTNTNSLSVFFPYTSILDSSYDRSERDKLHELLVDGEKDINNTREVED